MGVVAEATAAFSSMVKRKHALAEQQEDRNSSLLADPLQHLTEVPSLLQSAADGSNEVYTLSCSAQQVADQGGCTYLQCLCRKSS